MNKMNSLIPRERSYFQLQRKKPIELSNSVKRKESNSQSKVDKLSELNMDIEKLYKKYAEVKKERLMKEKNQQILVNRLKVLRSHQNSSKNKENLRDSEKIKIHVKKNSKFKNNKMSSKRYKYKKNDNIINNYKTFNDNKKENAITSSDKTNSNEYSNNNSEMGKRIIGSFNENVDINNIEDFLKTYKYNIENKNNNNNIYIIINNPNNYPEKELKTNDKINNYDYDNYTPRTIINNNELLGKEANRNKHIKSDINFDIIEKRKKIILMNSNGRKIEDIINSINSIDNIIENKRIDKQEGKNDIKYKEVINENNNIINNDNFKDNENKINNNDNKNITNENSINNNINIKDKDNNNNDIIEKNKESNFQNNEKDKIIKDIEMNENKNDNEKENIKIDDKIEVDDNTNNKNNTIEKNNIKNNEDNINEGSNNNIIKSNKKEEIFKKIKIINNNQIKEDNCSEENIRPNFLELYKNEDSCISKQKIDINFRDTSENRNINNNEENNNNNFVGQKNKNNETENNNLKINDSACNENNINSSSGISHKIYKYIRSNNNNTISDKKEIRKKVIIPNSKKININKPRNISPIDDSNDFIYLNKKKLTNMYNNFNKFIVNNTIQVPNNEEKQLNRIINTDDRNNIKKLKINDVYTPKKIEKNNKVKVNKKMEKYLANKSTKYHKNFIKSNKLKINNNNFLKYSLSYTNITNKNKISSNFHSNYNTKRNINLEKFKNNNFRKDTYCNSIERKRKALGIQFKPDFEKELSIQNDKINKFKIFDKLNNYNIVQKCLYNNTHNKNKEIKVNKRDDGSINIEGIKAPPQPFRIFKKNLENKNRHIFKTNKTADSFNYAKNSINCDIKNNLNDSKKRNIKKINKEKYDNIHSNFKLSENNNNSLRHMTDFNAIFVNNNTLNN